MRQNTILELQKPRIQCNFSNKFGAFTPKKVHLRPEKEGTHQNVILAPKRCRFCSRNGRTQHKERKIIVGGRRRDGEAHNGSVLDAEVRQRVERADMNGGERRSQDSEQEAEVGAEG